MAAISSSPAASLQPLAIEADARDHSPRRRQRQLKRVHRVEQVLLVLLQILVVSERKPMHHAMQSAQMETTRGAFARSSSAASGFFFWGMIEEPALHASGNSQKPNSAARPQHQLGPQPREMRGASGGSAQIVKAKSRLETASIEFGAGSWKPSSCATSSGRYRN